MLVCMRSTLYIFTWTKEEAGTLKEKKNQGPCGLFRKVHDCKVEAERKETNAINEPLAAIAVSKERARTQKQVSTPSPPRADSACEKSAGRANEGGMTYN